MAQSTWLEAMTSAYLSLIHDGPMTRNGDARDMEEC
jgi:hypothetical protein